MVDYKIVTQVPVNRGVNHKIDWAAVAAICREHPGEWVEVGKPLSSGMGYHINNGNITALPPAEFEATTRGTTREGGQRRVIIYVRKRP